MLSIGGDEEFGTKLQSSAISSEMGFPTTIVAMQSQAGEDDILRASMTDKQTEWLASA